MDVLRTPCPALSLQRHTNHPIHQSVRAIIANGPNPKGLLDTAQKATSVIPVRLINVDVQSALKLAIECNIYAYDAYFLQCAKTLSQPLLTLDNRMKQIAAGLNIEVLE